MLWDVAGVIEEWDLEESQTELFLKAIKKSAEMDGQALLYYRCAYACFRMGMAFFGAEQDTAERARLLRAGSRFKNKLARLLNLP